MRAASAPGGRLTGPKAPVFLAGPFPHPKPPRASASVSAARVTCSASDTEGNVGTATFDVTVVDTTAPTIKRVPADRTIEARGPTGAPFTYKVPLTSDVVDGATPLLAELEQSGIPREKILILVATGLHRPNVGDELAEMVGLAER